MCRILAKSVCVFVCKLAIAWVVVCFLKGDWFWRYSAGVGMKRTCFFLHLDQGFSNILMDYHGDCCGVFPVGRFRMPLQAIHHIIFGMAIIWLLQFDSFYSSCNCGSFYSSCNCDSFYSSCNCDSFYSSWICDSCYSPWNCDSCYSPWNCDSCYSPWNCDSFFSSYNLNSR